MNVLGIFVKYPEAGRVKTRLAADVGEDRAARLYEAFTADIVERFRSFHGRRVLCFAPDDAVTRSHFESLSSQSHAFNYEMWPQPDGSLGARMERFFAHSFADGAATVIIIGSDSPTLPREFIDQAVSLLDDYDCVLGPAADGGYYLIGQRDHPRSIFTGVDWGTARVLEQTVKRMAACDSSLAWLPQWHDVDTAADLDVLRHYLLTRQTGIDVVPHTARALDAD